MTRLRELPPASLSDRGERAQAKLARMARCDVTWGGATALRLARRLRHARFDADAVVTAAYHAHDGTARDYLAYACPECGSACFGQSAALEHCTF